MTEKGSDELLYEMATSQEVGAPAVDHAQALGEEDALVGMTTPEDDPGTQYPDPDEIPDGEPEEHDTNPEGGA